MQCEGGKPCVALRVLVDRSLVEVFVGGGCVHPSGEILEGERVGLLAEPGAVARLVREQLVEEGAHLDDLGLGGVHVIEGTHHPVEVTAREHLADLDDVLDLIYNKAVMG